MDKRRMCPNCRAFITTSDKVCPYCDVKLGQRAIDRRMPDPIAGGLIPSVRYTTVLILIINFGMYAATMLYDMQAETGPQFLEYGAKVRYYILHDGQWWRLITAGFLHGGMLHILMNSWVLFDLGTNVEAFYGTSRMVVIYFVSTVTGFTASLFWTPAPSVGASAGLFGLIGAMIALGFTEKTSVGAAIKGMYVRWLIYGLAFGLLMPMIDNGAHLGGAAGGFVIAYIARTPRLVEDWREKFWQYAAYASVGLTVWAFVEMFLLFSGAGS